MNWPNVNKKWNVFKVNNKKARTASMVSLFLILLLTLRILVSVVLTLNIFHILHDVKIAKIRALFWKKETKVSLTDWQSEAFSSCIQSPLPPSSEYRPIKFTLCRISAQGVLTGFYDISKPLVSHAFTNAFACFCVCSEGREWHRFWT